MRTDIINYKNDILQWIQEERPKSWIAAQLKCKPQTLNNWLQRMNIKYDGQQNKKGQAKGSGISNYIPVEEYIKLPNIRIPLLKQKLIREGYKEWRCEKCNLSTWLDQPIPLELHHIDGNHYNNNLNNLMILCPNCHTFTEGYNRKHERVTELAQVLD